MEPKFTKAKLSREALDAFVRKYSTTKFRDFVPYTTKVGEKLAFSATLLAQTPFANSEFAYFLAHVIRKLTCQNNSAKV